MCGRYYVDDDTAREIEKLVRQVDEKMRGTAAACKVEIVAKDINPTETAPILASFGSGLECRWQRWGFPGFQKGRVIFNASLDKAVLQNGKLTVSVEGLRKGCRITFIRNGEKVLSTREEHDLAVRYTHAPQTLYLEMR